MFLSACLSRTREVKQVFFISSVSKLPRSGILVKMSCICQITNANVETIVKVRRAPNTRLLCVGYMALVVS